ncbi:MAG: methyltransferase domain-containing protein [Bdellovibrionales bacterium]|nr:methyltransferase domain-containing protein [Bdellovibrionales bacterium]
MTNTATDSKDYVLGVTREEYERLGLQHSLWASRAIRLWRRAGLPEKSAKSLKAIDCGCGPGFTTFELANYLGPKSRVVGIDRAEPYLLALETRVREETKRGEDSRLAKIETRQAGIDTFTLDEKDFDAAYARWIFIFLKDPEAAIRNVARHLKPGGLFLFQDYVDYRTMALHPSPPLFRKMVEQIIASWAAHGGDANVAARLPLLLEKNGFEIVSLTPQMRVGRPHQKVWLWPDSFFKNYLPILARDGYLSAAEERELQAAWTKASRMKNAFYVGPTVLDIVARKR